jgi:hypothetical protein
LVKLFPSIAFCNSRKVCSVGVLVVGAGGGVFAAAGLPLVLLLAGFFVIGLLAVIRLLAMWPGRLRSGI